jgi:hypothetical protein
VLGPRVVATWTGIKRVNRPVAQSESDNPGEMSVEVAYEPAGPPFWKDYFTAKLKENGFREYKGYARGNEYQSITLRCPEDQVANAGALVDEAIDYANRQFRGKRIGSRAKSTNSSSARTSTAGGAAHLGRRRNSTASGTLAARRSRAPSFPFPVPRAPAAGAPGDMEARPRHQKGG